jgi:hypothetical protein
MAVFSVNGDPIPYGVTRLDGIGAMIELDHKRQAMPGRIGQHRMPLPTSNTRPVVAGLKVVPASVAARGAAVQACLAYFPRNTDLVLTFEDNPGKYLVGRRTKEASVSEAPSRSFAPEGKNAIVTVTIECDDPAYYDAAETELVIGTATAIAGGDLPHGGQIRIEGPATNPTISDGTNEIAFALTLEAGDSILLDLDLWTAVKTIDGVTSNAMNDIVEPEFFEVPDGAELSYSGGGTCTYTYRRRHGS